MENLQLDNFNESIAYCEAMGLSICFAAYAKHCSQETIYNIGFNENTGYVFIALENGITICSSFGHDAEFIIIDDINCKEEFFESYEEAEDFINR